MFLVMEFHPLGNYVSLGELLWWDVSLTYFWQPWKLRCVYCYFFFLPIICYYRKLLSNIKCRLLPSSLLQSKCDYTLFSATRGWWVFKTVNNFIICPTFTVVYILIIDLFCYCAVIRNIPSCQSWIRNFVYIETQFMYCAKRRPNYLPWMTQPPTT